MFRWLAVALAILFAPSGFAQTALAIQQQAQLQAQRVEAALNRLSQEQVAVFQQFQMIQEMRRNEERLALQRLPIYRLSSVNTAPSFDDAQRDEEARALRMNDLQAEGDRLYARYRELEEQKRPLLDTLSAMAQQVSVPPELPPDASALPLPTPVPPVTVQGPGFSGGFPGFTAPAPGFLPTPPPSPPPLIPTR
jgi:hypothetical protein